MSDLIVKVKSSYARKTWTKILEIVNNSSHHVFSNDSCGVFVYITTKINFLFMFIEPRRAVTSKID